MVQLPILVWVSSKRIPRTASGLNLGSDSSTPHDKFSGSVFGKPLSVLEIGSATIFERLVCYPTIVLLVTVVFSVFPIKTIKHHWFVTPPSKCVFFVCSFFCSVNGCRGLCLWRDWGGSSQLAFGEACQKDISTFSVGNKMRNNPKHCHNWAVNINPKW